MVLRLINSLFNARSRRAGPSNRPLIQAAIERVVDGTDPRLRLARRYRRTLRAPVERSLEYIMAQARVLPAAIEASRRGFTADPHLRALFASPEQLLETLSFSPALHDYRQRVKGSLPTELYAALRAERVERNTLGMALHGDQLQRDVPQVTVLFRDPRMAFPHPSEAETRQELMDHAFDYLIEIALHRLVSLRTRRQELEKRQQRLLQDKAGALRSARIGLESLLEARAAPTDLDIAAIEHQLAHIAAELGQLHADAATLDHHLALVAETLREPEQHLRLDPVSLTLDHMNIKVAPDSARVCNTLNFREVVVGERQRFIVLLVRFPSSELLAQPDFFAEAQRLLYLNNQPRLTTI